MVSIALHVATVADNGKMLYEPLLLSQTSLLLSEPAVWAGLEIM